MNRSAEWIRQRHRRVLRGLRLVFAFQLLFSVGLALLLDVLQDRPLNLLIFWSGVLVGLLLLPQARQLLRWLYLPTLLMIDIVHIAALLWYTPGDLLARGSLWALMLIPILVAAGRWWSYLGGSITLATVLLVDAAILFLRLPWRTALPVFIFQSVTAALGTWAAALTESRTRRDLVQREAQQVNEQQLRNARQLIEHTAVHLMHIGQLLHAADAAMPSDLISADRNLGNALTQTQHSLAKLQRALRTFGPSPLAEQTLAELVAAELHSLHTDHGITSDFHYDGHMPLLSPAIAEFIVHAIQELLHNVQHHSNARHVVVDLHGDEDHVVLAISDDGVGLAEHALEQQGSLAQIQARAQRLGGTIEIDGSNGATITLRLPVSAPLSILV